MSKLRLGVIGAGSWRSVICDWKVARRRRVHVVNRRTQSCSRKFKKRSASRWRPRTGRMSSAERCDIVIVGSPVGYHTSERGLELGRGLCEKRSLIARPTHGTRGCPADGKDVIVATVELRPWRSGHQLMHDDGASEKSNS